MPERYSVNPGSSFAKEALMNMAPIIVLIQK